jgi:hypothetical protein
MPGRVASHAGRTGSMSGLCDIAAASWDLRTPVCSRCLQLDDSAPERESDGVGPITRA